MTWRSLVLQILFSCKKLGNGDLMLIECVCVWGGGGVEGRDDI